MPSINLPTLDFTINSNTNKKELEQILDTLVKYRKELNFLLMNLDADNMPSIAGLIQDAYGNISLISQSIDEIRLLVADAENNIASLTVQSDNIMLLVSDNSSNIASLQIRADSIESSVADNASNISIVEQTATQIQSTVSNQAGQISSLTQTASGLQSTVSNQAGQISNITQTVNGIQSTVSSQNTSIGNMQSSITQLSASISSVVSFTDIDGNDVVSKINQTATTIQIQASKINLVGMTTLYGNDSGDRVVVNNGRIDFYNDGDNVFRIFPYSGGVGLVSPSENNIILDDDVIISDDLDVFGRLTVEESATFGSQVFFEGLAEFDYMPRVNGEEFVQTNREMRILQTSYGVTIQGRYGDITFAWD